MTEPPAVKPRTNRLVLPMWLLAGLMFCMVSLQIVSLVLLKPVRTWEHGSSLVHGRDLDGELSKMSAEGWEVIATERFSGDEWLIFVKRPR